MIVFTPLSCDAFGLAKNIAAECVFQAWHAFADIQVHPSVGCELAEVLLGNTVFRNYVQADLHIFILRHRGIVKNK